MVTEDLVIVTAEDLRSIASEFRSAGVEVLGIYFVRHAIATQSVKVVTWHDSHDFIYKLVALKRKNRLPFVASEVPINPEKPDSIEAERILDYASKFSSLPVTVRGVHWKGLYIDYALVVDPN